MEETMFHFPKIMRATRIGLCLIQSWTC